MDNVQNIPIPIKDLESASTITNDDYLVIEKSSGGTVKVRLEEIVNIKVNVAGMEKSFNDWFAKVKDTLDGDTAGKLQNQINAVEKDVEALKDPSFSLDEGGHLVATFK